jgi:hypothetical protein
MAGQESWTVSAEWMSGKTWTLQASPASTVGELKLRIMLASGGMTSIKLVLGEAVLGSDSEALCNVQGFENGATLNIAVSSEFPEEAARQVTDARLSAFVREFPQAPEIQDMRLAECTQVTDTGVIALAENCKLLSKVDLQDCNKVTDTGVTALAKNCNLLSMVDLQGCRQLTDKGLIARPNIATCCQRSTCRIVLKSRMRASSPWPSIASRCQWAVCRVASRSRIRASPP